MSSDPDLTYVLERILAVLEQLEAKLSGQQQETLTTEEACKLLKVSRATLERRMAYWLEGAHYWREGRSLRFDRPLLEDWQRHRNDPIAHQRAIDVRRRQLLSNKKRSLS